MAKDPAFLMYSKDWLTDTAEYMPDEKGVYIDLLCYQHQNKGLPTNTERLAKMVGVSHEQFLKIWDAISHHFDQMDNRLVNRKLKGIMTERETKSLINTITGTFAGLLRLGNFSAKQYKYLKDSFKADEFVKYPKNEISKRLTEWITERLDSWLKSIGNEDETYIELLNKVLAENNFDLPEGFKDLIIEWLKYKSQKRETYKEDGLRKFINKFLKDCGGNLTIAREMLDYSMGNNYSGLFKDKNKKNETLDGHSERGVKRINDYWNRPV
jgi:hypothetical protein